MRLVSSIFWVSNKDGIYKGLVVFCKPFFPVEPGG